MVWLAGGLAGHAGTRLVAHAPDHPGVGVGHLQGISVSRMRRTAECNSSRGLDAALYGLLTVSNEPHTATGYARRSLTT